MTRRDCARRESAGIAIGNVVLDATLPCSACDVAGGLSQDLGIQYSTLEPDRFAASGRLVKTVTTHQAKTHLSRLLKDVQAGETIVILSGSSPVAKLTAVGPVKAARPPVGTLTSPEVRHADDAFRPMTDDELEAWGV